MADQDKGHIWTITKHLRWAMVMVHRPSSFADGPGFNEKVKELQQAWVDNNDNVEWRPVPVVD